MASIDSLRQGNLKPAFPVGKAIAILCGLGLVVGGVVAAIVLVKKYDIPVSSPQEIKVASSYVPDDYYNFANSEPQETVITFIPDEAPKQPEVAAPVEVVDNTKPTPVATEKPAQKPLTPDEAFLRKQLDRMAMMEARRQQLVKARRAAMGRSGWNEVTPVEVLTVGAKKEEKAKTAPTDTDFSAHQMPKDTSTYPVDLSRTITTDRYIPCILNDQINSMLKGRVTCTVERNVFGVHGRNILIPAGSRLQGTHETLEKVGDERFNISWIRLIRPDGVHVKLTEAYASDRIGSTGLGGKVNNRRWEKYGAAVLTATVSAVAQMSIPREGSNIENTVIQSYATDLGRVTAAMLQETINIKPYAIVPAGTRVLVTPTTDIWLKKVGSELSFARVDDNSKTAKGQ